MLPSPNTPCCTSPLKTSRAWPWSASNPTAWPPTPKSPPATRNGAPEDFFTPPELDGHPLRALYEDTLRLLFETYHQTLAPVKEVIAAQTQRKDGESDAAFDRRIRSDYVDVCRFLLPAASLANLGITINARTLEHALRKMYSHPLAEVREVGAEIKQAADARIPTLIKYVDRVAYLEDTARDLSAAAADLPPANPDQDWCTLTACDPAGEQRVLAAALYRFGNFSFAQALEHVQRATPAEQQALAARLLGRRGRHDIPLRELEYAAYTLDLLLDQGGYFELKRHRMMTQTPQPLSTRLGYALPRAISDAGMEAPYRAAMNAAHAAFCRLEPVLPHVAAYVVPNGYNRRVLIEMNFRSALHLVTLRGAANAHFSMRRAAQRIADEICAVSPLLGQYIHIDTAESWQSVEQNYFTATAVVPNDAAPLR